MDSFKSIVSSTLELREQGSSPHINTQNGIPQPRHKNSCAYSKAKTLFRPLQQRRRTGSSELSGCLHKLATHSDPNHDSEIANQLRSVLAFIYRIIYATDISASSERDKSAFKSSKNKVGVLVLEKCKKRQGVIMSLPEKKND